MTLEPDQLLDYVEISAIQEVLDVSLAEGRPNVLLHVTELQGLLWDRSHLIARVATADDALTAYRTAYVHLLYHAYPITGEEMHQHFTKRFGLPTTTTQDMSSGAVTQDEYHVCEACAAQRDGESGDEG